MQRSRNRIYLIACLVLFMFSIVCLQFVGGNAVAKAEERDYDLRIHFIDVGQGDCSFIELPDGKTMLIDAGPEDNAKRVVKYIKDLGYKKIDYLVATHSDVDHIGGFKKVLEKFEVAVVYRPFTISTCTEINDFTDELFDEFRDLLEHYPVDADKGYAEFLQASYDEVCGDKLCEIRIASNQEIIVSNDEAGPYIIKFFMPQACDSFSTNRIELGYTTSKQLENNNTSAVVEVVTSTNKYLFMGDLTTNGEQLMIDGLSDADMDMLSDIDVLKVGHHGSDTSTSSLLLALTMPKNSIIMCEDGNDYGFPKDSVLNLLDSVGSMVYRTDKLGTIIVSEMNGGIIFTNIETVSPLQKWKWPLYILIGIVVIGLIVLIAIYPKIKKNIKHKKKKSETKLIKVVDKN